MSARKSVRILEISLAIGLACGLIWGALSMRSQQTLADRVVRLHILANSDSSDDQSLKLWVRDAILERAEEVLENTSDRKQAEAALRAALPELQALAAAEIEAHGHSYPVRAELTHTAFPTRAYEGFTLPAGEYLALRLIIGEGAGHNWWCVVFPPLCAAATGDVAQTAMAAGLSEEDVRLITEDGNGYVLKFKSIEIWEGIKEHWNSRQNAS